MTTSTTPAFSFSTTSLTTSVPLLDTGFYAGEIIGATTSKKDGTSFFKIEEEKVWNKVTKQREATGDYVISGMLMYGSVLTSKKAIAALQRDEPRVYGSPIFLRFNKETLGLENNQVVAQLLELAGLTQEELAESIDWEQDDDIEVPEELSTIDNIVTMLNALEYHKAIFTSLCQAIEGLPVKVNVIKRAQRDNPNMQENSLNLGTGSNPFCGFLAYEEGCEEDLEEA